MERISLVGLTWQAGGRELLDRSTIPEAARADALPRLAHALATDELLYLATCNRVEVAFVADNPRDWMFHCHILEHQAAGMMGGIRVSGKEERI